MRSLLRVAATCLALALVALAVLDQLVRDPQHRDWHGCVFCVPYEFRIPTIERLRHRLWTTDRSQVLVPTIFGVGWTINLGGIAHRARQTRSG